MDKEILEKTEKFQSLFTAVIGFMVINAPELLKWVDIQRAKARGGLR